MISGAENDKIFRRKGHFSCEKEKIAKNAEKHRESRNFVVDKSEAYVYTFKSVSTYFRRRENGR